MMRLAAILLALPVGLAVAWLLHRRLRFAALAVVLSFYCGGWSQRLWTQAGQQERR